MSHPEFQKALATLIRLPEHNRKNLEQFLNKITLSELEKENLRCLALNREVNKFGYKMRMFRLANIIDYIPLTLQHIDREKFLKFIETQFDPEHTNIFARNIYRAFRQFISHLRTPENSAKLKEHLGSFPAFFFDLLIFETLDGELDLQGFANEPLPEDNLLLHNNFEVLSLDFKIHQYAEKWRSVTPEKAALLKPKKQKTHLLFLIDENVFGYQVYEIDKTGVEFLVNARSGNEVEKPEYYSDFIDSGLCR